MNNAKFILEILVVSLYRCIVVSFKVMDIQFINCKEWGIEPKSFTVYIKRLKKYIPDTEGVLNVVFVNDSYIRALNKRYRDNDKPTDVLSFSYINLIDLKNSGLIGEIYISVPTAEMQAKEYKWKLENELCKLFVHGFLHIFGYDHESDEDYKKMVRLEEEILS